MAICCPARNADEWDNTLKSSIDILEMEFVRVEWKSPLQDF